MQACLKMYQWTGDAGYLTDPLFTNFYEKSVNEYVHRWALEPEKIMDRSPYMNQPEDFNPNNNFHTCRGTAFVCGEFPWTDGWGGFIGYDVCRF